MRAEQAGPLETARLTEAVSTLASTRVLTLPAGRQLPTESTPCSWRNPRDILRALHILRC
jgi:hypothetical protein